ncbi:tRNA (34-2'-O)-methyltransferase regulator WDR6 isoform X1 [Pantherophis guttatus]|uniref:tRNA (34-2'-O)-methyltransferase regulator WDR6 n=2 Tax=Pantherophis guttatus TaxID=94885 RepID=A0A6P9CWH0_PANGU|nr:tRNA (34-2'-O)-methyltransferase regulator WDR6 isoform X1 [Pantherophis guttatus]XP_034287579.1 tRNA (34-2'-O)-methyltransferase regulator WDR6 isoform X1 [Pantherophis guttatus]XP_034287580.1 tRNA (34-2'-O)-methyltransferase regulator WDR6 isoform X1 [Pantherophis guttatus]XP_034287581.1 tRNA (34-2'-O)-methyltransferase regulator WDR6 isoform X1 [Pantherophis guttatus]XP_060540287.1 tRNA (34-2'-O)-methyltransferase regulator WDR6 isoform X1 [Pantherophis guttatus]
METELLLAPITALEMVGDHLIAGEGPYVGIYSLSPDASPLARCSRQVLQNYTVHGIKEQQSLSPGGNQSSTLAIFGGKSFVVVELSFQSSSVELNEVFPFCELHDWIWDLQWMEGRTERPSSVAVALGHNSVALYDCVGQRVLQEVHCQEKCILYSAHLVGSRWETLVLVAGTVFHQLVVWRVTDQTDDTGRIKPRSRISGHSGVIFSICFLESQGILASASDDRSVRLWSICDLRTPPAVVPCLLVCYGHQSRVWSVRLLRDYIISIGEDSACLVWTYQGKIVHSFKGHKGQGLRAVAVDEERGWVFTGGADSGIRQWCLKERSSTGNRLRQLDFPSTGRKGSPRAVKLVDENHLLVMTDAGAVYSCDLTPKTWALLLEDAAYQSYSLLEVSKLASGGILCAMGNLSGQVKVFPFSSPAQSKELNLFEGKVHTLTWATELNRDPNTCNLFASGPAGALLRLEISWRPLGGTTVVVKQCFLLPVCKQRWHTCIAFLPRGEFLLCGDRRGSLMMFACKPTPGVEEAQGRDEPSCSTSETACALPGFSFPIGSGEPHAERPVSLLFGLHGKQGVTSVTCHGGFIYSTGRDSCYRQLQVKDRQLQVLRKQKPCKDLEWLEELRFGPNGSLRVLGFHATHFVIWSASSNEKLLCIPCGGGHRSWSYARCLSVETFAYIKSGEIWLYQSKDASSGQRILKAALHGKGMTCVCHVGTLEAPGRETISVFATGSEDNTVNVLAFNVQTRRVTQLAALGDHISSIRALTVVQNGLSQPERERISAMLFSAGGRAQIECYRLALSPKPGSSSGVACQLVHVASHRLDEQWDYKKNKHKLIKMDPETRYMSVVVLARMEEMELPGPLCFLAAACSDGSVRLFLLLENAKKLCLVAESFHHQHCVLKVEAFAYKMASGRRRHFMGSAATDGSIAFWDITAALGHFAAIVKTGDIQMKPLALESPVLTVQAHSCGVNSLHIQKTAERRFVVVSGGDNGSISVHVIEVKAESAAVGQETPARAGIQVIRKVSRLCAHAAHVTGVRLLHLNFLLSASVDQRLTLWSLCEDSLSFVWSKFCHVADVAALECWETEGHSCRGVICGQGLQVLSWGLDARGGEIKEVI